MQAVDQEFKVKQEDMFSKAPPSRTRQWSVLKNPRIYRVPRSFGAKDRHSKVYTVRGVRDRRIRLSVPTAVQLYNLQDKLGFSQPSKVIDWLLEASKDDIDKLPPLPVMPYGFSQFDQQMHANNASQSSLGFSNASSTFIKDGNTFLLSNNADNKINNNAGDHHHYTRSYLEYCDAAKHKNVEAVNLSEKGKWIEAIREDNQIGSSNYNGQSSVQNLFPISHSTLPALLNNAAMPYNSNYHYEPPNLSLSQFSTQGLMSLNENALAANALTLQSSLAHPSVPQLFFCPSAATAAPLFPYSPLLSNPTETSTRQIEHLKFLSSNAQQLLPLSLSVNPWLVHSQSNNGHPVKDSTDL